MNLLNFISEFPNEESCKSKWKEYRDNIGVVCIKCGCEQGKRTKKIDLYL